MSLNILSQNIRKGKLLVFVCFFVYFFNVKIKGIPITSNMILAVFGFLVLLTDIFFGKRIHFDKHFLKFVFSYILLLCVSFLSLLLHFTFDFSLIKSFGFNFPLTFLGAYFIVNLMIKYKFNLSDSFKVISLCFFYQCIITLYFFLNKELMLLVFDYCDMGDRINILVRTLTYRAYGLFFGFDYGTAELTVACLCSLYLFLTEKKRYTFWLLIVIFNSIIGIIVARTMFIGIFIIVMFFILYPCEFKKRKKNTFLFFLCGSFFMILFIIPFVDFSKYEWTILWVTDIFTQLSSGDLKSGSLYEILHNMIWYPGHQTFFFGDGFFKPNGIQYQHTDVGYMRLILYYGVVGTIITVLFIIRSGQAFWYNKMDKGLRLLTYSIMFLQLIFMYKIMYILFDFFSLFLLFSLFPLKNEVRMKTILPNKLHNRLI